MRVSYETVRRMLAAAEIVLSRPQHTISSPDPEYAVKKWLMRLRRTLADEDGGRYAPAAGRARG